MSENTPLVLKVFETSQPKQFRIESNYYEADGKWEDIYVSFSGHSGKYSPHIFAAAPDLFDALQAKREAYEKHTSISI